MENIHFTGPVWRPPYEANSVLLQATVGCSHDKCKFCSLYPNIKFRVSPITEVESDLKLIQRYQPKARRVFLTGANPFVLSHNKLIDLGLLIRRYLPHCENIGTFARITDIKSKSIEELKELRQLGFNGLSVGTESGDDDTLSFMNKGNTVTDIYEQCKKLEEAGIEYYIVYLAGLAGIGNGERNAFASAKLYSQLTPTIISVAFLTIFPESELYLEVENGTYKVSSEKERLEELKIFVANLSNKTTFFANTISNPILLSGILPKDKNSLVNKIQLMLDNTNELELQRYRKSITSL